MSDVEYNPGKTASSAGSDPGGAKKKSLHSIIRTARCNRCQEAITPVVDTYPTWKTHVIAAILFIIGLPFCIYLPYCFDCCGVEVLRCPKCGCYVK